MDDNTISNAQTKIFGNKYLLIKKNQLHQDYSELHFRFKFWWGSLWTGT